ncbi:hypothetical protein [Streptomyces sp. NPDC002913]
MSVTLVRRAIDHPDEALPLLTQHLKEAGRQGQDQDEAVRDAHELLASPPEAVMRHVDGMTVASKPVPRLTAGRRRHDWNAVHTAITAAVQEVVRTVELYGAAVAGTPWGTAAAQTPEQKGRSLAGEGPHRLVKVPVTGDEQALASLPGDIELETFEPRDELSVFIPGKCSMAKYGSALSRILTHPLDAAYVDTSRMRHLLHTNGTETAAAIRVFRGTSVDE